MIHSKCQRGDFLWTGLPFLVFHGTALPRMGDTGFKMSTFKKSFFLKKKKSYCGPFHVTGDLLSSSKKGR